MIVLLYHVFTNGFPPTAWAESTLRLWLPFNGFLAVAIFFIVSGFALSTGFVRTGDRQGLLRIAIGRYFRLFVPVAGICLVVHVALLVGAIAPPADRPAAFRNFLTFEPSLDHLLSFTIFEVFFDYRPERSYVAPLWTITIELLGSFAVLAGLAVVGRARWRWMLYGATGLGLLYLKSLYFLFLAGVVLAELLANRTAFGRVEQAAAWAAIAQGLAAPFLFAWQVSPELLISTVLFCWGAIVADPVRRFLSSELSSRLGVLSFPLYLVHGPLMFIVGIPLYQLCNGSGLLITLAGAAICVVSILCAIPFVRVNEAGIQLGRAVSRKLLVPRRL